MRVSCVPSSCCSFDYYFAGLGPGYGIPAFASWRLGWSWFDWWCCYLKRFDLKRNYLNCFVKFDRLEIIFVKNQNLHKKSGLLNKRFLRMLSMPPVVLSSCFLTPSKFLMLSMPPVELSSCFLTPFKRRLLSIPPVELSSCFLTPSRRRMLSIPPVELSSCFLTPLRRRMLSIPPV